VRHGVAKFFGVADEDPAEYQRTIERWRTNTQRVQKGSFVLSRPGKQRKAPTASCPATAGAGQSPVEESIMLLPSSSQDVADAGLIAKAEKVPLAGRYVSATVLFHSFRECCSRYRLQPLD